ncbi:MAG: T9SS C-terminal target domain-containing protein, partial [Calditrichaeota bacterium]
HWNNAQEKKYSRNLNTGDGVELVIAGAATNIQEPIHPPQSSSLLQNYPNPFNSQTRFTYDLPAMGFHTLAIYNASGEQVILLSEGVSQAGHFQAVWNGLTGAGEPASSGLYFARLTTSERTEILKVSLVK